MHPGSPVFGIKRDKYSLVHMVDEHCFNHSINKINSAGCLTDRLAPFLRYDYLRLNTITCDYLR